MDPGQPPGFFMFTVKVYRGHGSTDVYSCERYTLDSESPVAIALFTRGIGWETVEFDRQRDTVFVENLMGKTIHALRPPRAD